MPRPTTRRIRPFHWLPKPLDTQVLIEVNDINETSQIKESSWIKPVTTGIGNFSLKLKNAGGLLSAKYQKGQTVKFYADNSDASRLQFQGRIDYIKDVMDDKGHFLEIEGRHRSYILNETKVCYEANTETEISVILKAIIDQLPTSYGFTYTNVNTTTISIKINWTYAPFWDCVIFLCKKANYDCYVDNNLDFHFFEKGTIENNDWAIVEGQNFRRTEEIGTDDYYEKTRVIGIGKMEDGITPIIYTAIIPNEGSEIREVKIEDSTLSTMESVQAMAEGELSNLQNMPVQANIISRSLETVEPGEKIWIVIPRQKIHGQFRLVQITHKFNEKGWTTESIIEKKIKQIEDLIKERITTENMLSTTDNINKLNYSYNFSFDNDDLTSTHDQTHIFDGNLELSDGSYSEGTWISKVRNLDSNASNLELRYKGKDLSASIIYFKLTGDDWQNFGGQRILKVPSSTGRLLQIKVKLVKNSANPWPAIDSIGVLYS